MYVCLCACMCVSVCVSVVLRLSDIISKIVLTKRGWSTIQRTKSDPNRTS